MAHIDRHAKIRKVTFPHLPRVLVLMATYNGGPWVEMQLNSIFAQSGVDITVLVSDDGSEDQTMAALQRFLKNPAFKISIIRTNGNSGSAGKNFQHLIRSANSSSFDWIALADQDDIWLEDKLACAIEKLQAQAACAYSCAVEAFWPDGRKKTLAQSPRITHFDFIFEGAGQGCTFVLEAKFFCRVQAHCIAFRTAVEKMHYHDWLIYLLCRVWGLRWTFDAVPKLRYRQHGENEIGARSLGAGMQHRLKLVRSGWYRNQIVAAIDVWATAVHESSHAGVHQARKMLKLTPSEHGENFGLRLSRAGWFFRHGRRRLSDRLALAVFAFCAWI